MLSLLIMLISNIIIQRDLKSDKGFLAITDLMLWWWNTFWDIEQVQFHNRRIAKKTNAKSHTNNISRGISENDQKEWSLRRGCPLVGWCIAVVYLLYYKFWGSQMHQKEILDRFESLWRSLAGSLKSFLSFPIAVIMHGLLSLELSLLGLHEKFHKRISYRAWIVTLMEIWLKFLQPWT